MKTLFERLKPEFASKIVDEEFPGIAERLIIELEIESFFFDLRLSDVTQLYKYVYGIREPFKLIKFYTIFND